VSRIAAVLWTIALACSCGLFGLSGARYCRARACATEDLSRLALVSRQAGELTSLRTSAPAWMLRTRPPTGLTPRITAALAASGLPAAAVSSVSPESESPVGDSDLKARRSRATLTLAGITLPQLGAFLQAWRSREPQWTISSLDLVPQAGQPKAESTGGDLPLRVVIGMETLFVDRPEPAAAGRGFVDQAGGAR
jgi:hypothetical protein